MRFVPLRDWSLRSKLAALLVAAALVPLVISIVLDYRAKSAALLLNTHQLLSARAEQLARELDTRHEAYLRTVTRAAKLQVSGEVCRERPPLDSPLGLRMAGVLATFPASDRDILGLSIVAKDGTALASTLRGLVGTVLPMRSAMLGALGGQPTIGTVDTSHPLSGEIPTVPYAVPVLDAQGQVTCVAVLLVQAKSLWKALPGSIGGVGAGSYALIVDELGIRLAHALEPSAIFIPTQPLRPEVVEELVRQQRFGTRTREYLRQSLSHPELYRRAVSAQVDESLVLSNSPITRSSIYTVARRLQLSPWTVFYATPASNVTEQLRDAAVREALVGAGLLLVVLLAGYVMSTSILRTIGSLAEATEALASGDRGVRVPIRTRDELGRLGTSFNAMADQLDRHAVRVKEDQEDLEARIAERTELLHTVMENAPAVVFACDLQGRFLQVNEPFCDLFQCRPADVLGRTAAESLPQAAWPLLRIPDAPILVKGGSLVEEVTVPSEGELLTFISVKRGLHARADRLLGSVCIATDITDRKRSDSQQFAQLARLRLLDEITFAIGERHDLQSIYQVVIDNLAKRLDADHACILGWNAVEGKMEALCVAPGTLQLAEALCALPDARDAGRWRDLRDAVSGQLTHFPDTTHEGSNLPATVARAGVGSLVLAPLIAEGDTFALLLVGSRRTGAFTSDRCEFLRQLSQHVALAAHQARLLDQLRAINQELRQSQQTVLQQERLRALGQMASGIAHDINNALSPAALYAEMLLEREDGLSERGRAQLAIIGRAVDDVGATVVRMREFYRPNAEEAMLPMDLNWQVLQVIELTHARWSDMPQLRGVTIELKLDLGEALPPVRGVESEVREALINLVFNAVDAMPVGGTLTVRSAWRPATDSVDLEVADTGVGMDAVTRQRCLEPFFTTKGERGTGLGLAMVYGFAQRHGVAIDVQSAPGAGTTMTLRFPPANNVGAPPVAAPEVVVSPRRLLVIDDDPALLASLEDSLVSDGHRVSTACGGRAGIDTFRRVLAAGGGFDLVLTDLGMPYVDGLRVAKAVKALSPGTPVVVLTGWGHLPTGESAAPSGVDRVLSKPPRLIDLRHALAQLTRDPRAETA